VTRRALAHSALDKIEAREATRRAERPVYEITCRDPKRAEDIRAMGFAVKVWEDCA
jgi:hypothetical protein